MRGDRLLSIMMLLQSRGKLSAGTLARELEVSERTIYRDIDALAISGVPVYAETGRDGGFALLESYRTNLTGMTDGELRALFALSIPAPLVGLGLSGDLRKALEKLSAALPGERRSAEEQMRQRVYLDATWWHQQSEEVPYLKLIYQAVMENRQIEIRYRLMPALEVTNLVEPYSVVAKAGVWYLVCSHYAHYHVHRVSNLLDARISGGTFARNDDFDLMDFWKNWCREEEDRHSSFHVRLRIAPGFIPHLPYYFGGQVVQRKETSLETDQDGWYFVEMNFESLEDARKKLLALGGGVEVLSPKPLRASIQDFGQQITKVYEKK